MAVVRALAIHIPSDFLSIDMLDKVVEVIDRVMDCIKRYKVDPWTLRLVYPALISGSNLDLGRYLNDIFSVVGNSVMISIGIEESLGRFNDIVQLLYTHKRFYSSIRCDTDYCIEKAVNSLYLRKDVDINIYTKLALLIGSWVETPYFPATSNTSNSIGLSASLRYVDLVDKALFNNLPQELFNFIELIRRQLENVSSCSGIPFLGMDLSLSPWKEESVARLVEKLIGNKIGFPGTLNAISSLNKLIEGIIKRLKILSIGFNEVMLPVAEDNVLNERVRDGDIRLRDLIGYSTVCVAGVDMTAVPRSVDIRRIAIDLFTIYKIKKKSIGMRIIPVDQEPGSAITLEMFGTTYIIKP